jgi:hypothetical protein
MNFTGAPIVSVLMPAYNAEPYLKSSVESILTQTFRDLELIVVDDGSSDGTLAVLDQYGDARLRVYARGHRGLSATRNEALALARGEFVAWMDADDVSHATRLEAQVDYLRLHPHVGIVGTWASGVDATGYPVPLLRLCPPKQDLAIRLWMPFRNCFVNGSTMFRRAVASHLSFHGELAPVEDYDFWIRLSERCAVANLQRFLYQYRLHARSATGQTGTSRMRELAESVRETALERAVQRVRARGCAGQGTLGTLGMAERFGSALGWSLYAATRGRPHASKELAGGALRIGLRDPAASLQLLGSLGGEAPAVTYRLVVSHRLGLGRFTGARGLDA